MPLSKEEIKKGVKASDKGSLEYRILEFLEKAKSTDTPAHSLADITKALDSQPREDIIGTFLSASAFSTAINELKNCGKIAEIIVKNDTTKYYMAKDESRIKSSGGLGKLDM